MGPTDDVASLEILIEFWTRRAASLTDHLAQAESMIEQCEAAVRRLDATLTDDADSPAVSEPV